MEFKENNSNNNSAFITTEDSNDGSKILKNIKSSQSLNKLKLNKTKPLAILSIEEMPGNHMLLSPIEKLADVQSYFGSLKSKKQVNK